MKKLTQKIIIPYPTHTLFLPTTYLHVTILLVSPILFPNIFQFKRVVMNKVLFFLFFHFIYNDGTPGYHAPTTIEVETQFITSSAPAAGGVTSPASTVTSPASTKNLLSPSPRKSPLLGFRNHNKNAKNNNTLNIPQEDTDESPKKSVTKFNFHMRHSKKKKDTRRDRRERKATTTLAIVLGMNFIFYKSPL